MNGLQDYYGQQYGSMDPERGLDGYAQDENMGNMGSANMDNGMTGHSQTLDQIINSNNQELSRRRSNYQPQYRPNGQQEHVRRSSMMEFGSSDLADFQFDPNPAPTQMPQQNQAMGSSHKSLDPRKVRSREDLSLDTRFSQMNSGYDMPNVSSYSPGMMTGSAVDSSGNYMPNNMEINMDYDPMSGETSSMGMQHNSLSQPMYTTSPVSHNYNMAYSPSHHDPGSGNTQNQPQMHSAKNTQSTGSGPQNYMKKSSFRRPMAPSPLSMAHSSAGHSIPSPAHMAESNSRQASFDAQSPYVNNGNMTMEQVSQNPMVQGPTDPMISKFANAYSSSGFDMLGVLMRVATRRKPDINIGPVDLSCAFVVCDVEKHDLPIVYCSDMFERLTGYTRYEILGRNCRFLQAPDGKVQSGVKRKYVDDSSVLQLKNSISKRAEAQLSLINYRKGGQPFMNLLTMIPITWDTEEIRFFVGFQVDLVEQPNSVSGKNPDGTYAINYNRSSLPAYSLPPPPDPKSALPDMGQTISRDEVSQVLSTIGNGESELSKRVWDKVLLENTDDVVHVLSLKGLFLYLSPASRKVLEYDASELVGTPLSSVCHPSDIVPVTRELKDSSGGAPVNVVYRIRRKQSGYTWFEAHGCLHTEQGKGRKCIILVGRQRPVFALNREDISNEGGVGDSELWSKLSTSGMLLYISSTSRAMLDRVPEDLIGTSMQSMMRPESKKDFLRVLEMARTGEKASFKHDLQNRRGQVLQAQTTLYPGDARQDQKPTFLLAQTRLLKMSRAMLLNQQKTPSSTSIKSDIASAASGTPNPTQTSPSPGLGAKPVAGEMEGQSGIMTSAGGNGLPLGNQDEALASEDNIFDELKTTRSTSWQFELRQMERQNRLLAEELQALISRKKKRKRRKGLGQLEKDCANCHTRVTPEWRRGPSGQRDLCNSCGLRWAKQVSCQCTWTRMQPDIKQNGRVSPRKYGASSEKSSTSPAHVSPGNASGATDPHKNSASPALEGQHVKQEESELAQPTQREKNRDTVRGTMPPKIEEGEEPPHPTVLPT